MKNILFFLFLMTTIIACVDLDQPKCDSKGECPGAMICEKSTNRCIVPPDAGDASTDATYPSDGAVDASSDAGTDSGVDAGIDGGVDASYPSDGSTDTGLDGGIGDTGITDTGADGGDAGFDAGYDAGNVEISDISPANPYVTVNNTEQFSATVTGSLDTVVNWSATAGSITGTGGLFTAPGITGDVTITATAHANLAVFKTTTAHVVAAPDITSFTANPDKVTKGETSNLTGVFTGGVGLVDNSVGTVTTGAPKTTGAINSDTTFTLTVTNAAGDYATKPVTVNAYDSPYATISAPAYVTINQTGYKASVPDGQAGMDYTWSVLGGNITAGTGTREITFTPTSLGAMTIEASVKNGAQKEAKDTKYPTVVAAPSITSFSANPSSMLVGEASNLTAIFSGGTGKIDPGNITVSSGTPVAASPAVNTEYTLTITNLAGTATTQKTPITITTDCGVSPTGKGGDMCRVPAGDFMMGCNIAVDNECESDGRELPYHKVTVPLFMIDEYEVTSAQYKQCVDASVCSVTDTGGNCTYNVSGKENHPINCLDWNQMKAYCQWVGKRFPTEAEWEKAARGTDGRKYPWGNTPSVSCDYAVMKDSGTGQLGCGAGGTMQVGSKVNGISPYGAYDMLGNVWEWTEDDWHTSYSGAPVNGSAWIENPRAYGRVVRGGSWGGIPSTLRASTRGTDGTGLRAHGYGFRCALSGGSITDGGTPDSGVDSGLDSSFDAGVVDGGVDAGVMDAGTDAGTPDAGLDGGPVDVGCTARTLWNFDFTDNQTPPGWTIEKPEGQNAGIQNGRIEANPTNGRALLKKSFSPSAGDKVLVFEWDASISYSYWGQATYLWLNLNGGYKLQAGLYCGEYTAGNFNEVRIGWNLSSGNKDKYTKLPQENGTLHFQFRVQDGSITFAANYLNGTPYFYYSYSEELSDFKLSMISEVVLDTYTTSGAGIWSDNFSAAVECIPSCSPSPTGKGGDMCVVPEGIFNMGCNNTVDSECSANEDPYHLVNAPEFKIDKYEVTVSQYAACNTASPSTCTAPNTGGDCSWGVSGRESHPINCVDWNQAKAYCAWAGKRLPSEAEWEKAARGTDGRKYPWGNTGLDCDHAVMSVSPCSNSSTAQVGSKPSGVSQYGAMDMMGNAYEWVEDDYHSTYNSAPADGSAWVDIPRATFRTLRGGYWGSDSTSSLRSSHRSSHDYPYDKHATNGFRCAQ